MPRRRLEHEPLHVLSQLGGVVRVGDDKGGGREQPRRLGVLLLVAPDAAVLGEEAAE